MVFFFASDLHFGVNRRGDASCRQLAAGVLARARPDDVLLLGGDLGVDDVSFGGCLELFAGFPGRRFAIAGNHDVWVTGEGDSWARYRGLSALMKERGFHPLEDEPAVVGEVGLVGSLAWYDYSFRDDIGVPLEHYRQKCDPESGVIWSDARFVKWSFSDEEMTEWQLTRLGEHLKQLQGVRSMVALLHHVPTKQLLVHPRWMVPRRWRFANAFLGSERFARLLSGVTALRHVVNGHIHLARSATLGHQVYTSIGGDYQSKELVTLTGDRIERQTFEALPR